MGLIDDKFQYWCQHAVDIREHLPTIKKYATGCDSIVEMGVRSIVSTWALLAGRPRKLTSIDICHPSFYGANINEVYDACSGEGIAFEFIQASTLDVVIEEADLVFIDTLHTYDQLSKELALHGDKATKYIIFHDTESCKEMNPAIYKFIQDSQKWGIKEVFTNNNGLMVLQRCSNDL